jgi:hypothetical protein
MNALVWLLLLFVLGAVVMVVLFAFVAACEKV